MRLRVAAVGVCHTDLSWADGRFGDAFPGVAGHEIAGVVDAVGEGVDALRPGDRVVASVIRRCGACARCAAGEPTLCERRDERPQRLFRDGVPVVQAFGTGGFAEATVVDASAVLPVPDGVPLTAAAVVGCAVVTGYGAVFRLAEVKPGATVAVVGCGAVGVAAVASAAAAGAGRVVALDPDPARREAALAFGASETHAPEDAPPLAADAVLEAVGSGEAARLAVALARRGGAVVLMGLPAAGSRLELDHLDLVVGQKRLLGCNMGNVRPEVDVPAIFELAAAGRLDLAGFVGGTFPLAEAAAAFADARARRGLRTVVVPG
ncbi:MAG TPA: alcohol dehydrogenase catalytic domain-containing protein [Gaiellaceae bacterium]|nr:alcohol dehydrogenase catalytic domain-containing protein [Gaiellaceae bacterium]